MTVVCLIADHERYLTAVSFGLSAFVLFSVFGEYHRAVKARKLLGVSSGLVQVIRSRPQRYGGLLVHVGVAVMAISITASMGYKTERDIILKPNERYDIGRFSLNLLDIHQEDHENYAALVSTVQVFERGGDVEIGRLHPERRSYKVNEEVTTEVDIRITPREDLYLALAGIEGESNAVMKVFINPLQMWLWVGSILMLGGTAVVLLPRGERVKSNEELLQTVGRTVEGAHP